MFEGDEYRLTDRPKEYFEWLKDHKNFPVDRYDIFMNKMKANGFKTLEQSIPQPVLTNKYKYY